MKTVLFLLFLTIVQSASAQTGEEDLYKQYKKAEKELNVVYNTLKNKLTPKDKSALISAQKAWILYRDANCKFLSKEDSDGGVIANKIKLDCLEQTTRQRIKELKDLMKDF